MNLIDVRILRILSEPKKRYSEYLQKYVWDIDVEWTDYGATRKTRTVKYSLKEAKKVKVGDVITVLVSQIEDTQRIRQGLSDDR